MEAGAASNAGAPSGGRAAAAIYDFDPLLEEFSDHIEYRARRYEEQLAAIEEAEGSLLDFAKGWETMGFTEDDGNVYYREWVPSAQAVQLIGDFNDWVGWPLEPGEFGVWSLKIPKDGPEGKPIPHGSRVKVRIQTPNGDWVDRIPAWIRYATVDPGSFGAAYHGVYWNPPPPERHAWTHPRPDVPKALRVYEAHVGMSGQEPRVATYAEFADKVLPRIRDLGYNAVQLMAIQEHSYYGSFGYHVTNAFAVSSRSGTPEDLKRLVDAAHGLGLVVIMDLVHSHASNNVSDGLNGFDFGQSEEHSYFLSGPAGYHRLWDSRLFNYKSWEVLRYLLSNVRWWIDEYRFDGFRFDGVTSMLYHHHGIDHSFSGAYAEYFGLSTNVDAVVYLMLANALIKACVPSGGVAVAEDVSGMPTLCRTVEEGGLGFDYRLAMGVPDWWIDVIKHRQSDAWSVDEMVATLCNRRYTERTVGYCESHDQSIVGDQTIAFRLMGADMYDGMSALTTPPPAVARGVALHKLIRAVTMAIGGEGWMSFMGNEFGHPEWVDFPREENGWSYDKARRMWNLADAPHLRYRGLLLWDRALQRLEEAHGWLASAHQVVTTEEDRMILVAERGPLVFAFNWSGVAIEGLRIGVGEAGKYVVCLESDHADYGGEGRVYCDAEHFTEPIAHKDRPCSMQIALPPRTVVAYVRA